MAANLYKVPGSGQTPFSLAVVVGERLVVLASGTYTLEVVAGTWGHVTLASDSEAVAVELELHKEHIGLASPTDGGPQHWYSLPSFW
jgi:hypothetical protein